MGNIYEADVFSLNGDAVSDYFTRPTKVGVSTSSADISVEASSVGSNEWGYSEDGRLLHEGMFAAGKQVYGFTGDRIMGCVDFDLGYLWIGLNGVWLDNGNPETGANPTFTGITQEVFPYINIRNLLSIKGHFKNDSFEYTKPSGFSQWATPYNPEVILETSLSISSVDTTSSLQIDSTSSYEAKSIIIDIADNWGDGSYLEFRQIDFYKNDVKLTHTEEDDFTAYGTFYAGTLEPGNIYDTSTSKTGISNNNGWVHTGATNTRTICVFDEVIEFDEIRVNNGHHNGGNTTRGFKNIKIYTSSDSITSLVYDEAISNSAKIFDGSIAQHTASDVEDEEIITLI